ncbi:hypothetical protein NA56DRAFT_645501 [Hyaloscypha hepaticicola]|jgi:hypothetical protein|uniref:Uncharacterized protein n=1 Tax=Hyaloscypha hepaticicola TaxID=2082293 RepID=A0A2J6Q5Z6_9HELO|nr:hypothetical protein NA56DRAFT_645501 [Hyaloscypha hepaticicola]
MSANPSFPAQPDTQNPGSVEHALQVLNNIFQLAQGQALAEKSKNLDQCYFRLEEILDHLLKHYQVNVTSERDADGQHTYHDDLITAFNTNQSLPGPLRASLGGALSQNILLDLKKFRNGYKNFGQGRISAAELQTLVNTAVNGLTTILPKVEQACQQAKIMSEPL